MTYLRSRFAELQRRARLIAALSALAFAPACSSIMERAPSSKAEPLDLEGLWIAQGFPCGDGLDDVQMTVRQQQKLLAAYCAAASECAPIGALMWQGELPALVVASDDLPFTLSVELAVPTARTAAITVLSAEHMVLLVDETTVKLQRGTARASPMFGGTGGRGGADSPPENKPQPTASGSSSAAMSGASGVAGEVAAAGNAAAAGSGSGGAGMSSAAGARSPNPAAGSGGPSALAGGGAGAGGRTGSEATPAGGSSGGAGTGGGSTAAGSFPPGPVLEPDLGGRNWFCINALGSCSCVVTDSASQSGVDCATKYPCCYTDISDPEPDCICNAEISGSCFDFGPDDPDYRPVDWCPGQRQ